jgi:transcriptional regulator with XRE-family HTH domain
MHQTKLAANALDRRIGANLRRYRKGQRKNIQDLAMEAGVSFQQINKYENGSSRVSAAMAWILARALGLPVSALYEGLEEVNVSIH